MGCDRARPTPRRGEGVSIHAPAWGATAARPRKAPCRLVSIHAPAWGATGRGHGGGCRDGGFNPRTRVGCDRRKNPGSACSHRFQSTHPRGVRRWGSTSPASHFWFQSTHPRGVRRFRQVVPFSHELFQSTHPRGVRPHAAGRARDAQIVSIHAPAWGATQFRYANRHGSAVSIHAPAWGATPTR